MISLIRSGLARKEVFISSQKNLFLLLILIFLSSCGTLKKRDNIVFADSFPRGLKVKNDKAAMIGVTPFFLEVDTFKSRVYSFYSDEKVKLDVRYGCPFDWGGSIVPNMIFIFQPVISLSFILTDLLTGGAYVCSKPIFVKFTDQQFRPKLRKKRIVVLPIATRDKVLSDKIIKLWKKKVFNKHKRDELIIWNDLTESAFFVRGLDHYADTRPENIRRRFLNEIGMEFDATHFLHFVLKKDKENKLIEVDQNLYDAFTLKQESADYVKRFKIKDTEYDRRGLLNKIVDSLYILPNSIRGGVTRVDYETRHLDKSIQHKVDRHPDQLNQLLTFIGLDSVHHPRFFNSWDFAGFFTPSIGASSFKSKQELSDGTYEALFETYYIDYNASLRVFTPFGQIGTGIGLGFMGFNFSDNRNLEYSSTGTYLHIFYDYTYFLGDRWYVKLKGNTYFPRQGKVHSDYYDLNSWNEISLTVGYYFPEIKSITRKILPF